MKSWFVWIVFAEWLADNVVLLSPMRQGRKKSLGMHKIFSLIYPAVRLRRYEGTNKTIPKKKRLTIIERIYGRLQCQPG